jgi:hypothetical protein
MVGAEYRGAALTTADAFCRQTSAACAFFSTSTTWDAPRLAASSPSAPDPANRSKTRAPRITSRASRAEKIASRTRSLVGRVPVFGTLRVRDPAKPATIRVIALRA